MNNGREICLEIENLNHRYKDGVSDFELNDICFKVMRGEFFVVLGPNGSGKSTLMRLLAGIEIPVSGNMFFSGKPLLRFSGKKKAKRVAYVPQFFPETLSMTCHDLVMSGRSPYQGILGIHGKDDIRIVEESLSFVDALDFKTRNCMSLSGGERQRVFIAAAIAQEPDLLIIDEPTSALDPGHQVKIMDLLHRLSRIKGTTLVIVLHDINLAAMYADMVLLLKNGRVVSSGTPLQVMTGDILEKVYDCHFSVETSSSSVFSRFFPVSEII